MSDARSITLRLSVRDADLVRTQLLQMGEAGERALSRLDAAAQRVGGGASGGGALRQVAQAGDEAGNSTRRLGQVMGQAGFQIQDFASQVAGGQSALVALGQQGSQLLGVFGVGGAIAGAVLTVGVLAAQFLGLGKAGEDAGKQAADAAKEVEDAQKALATAIRVVNDLFLTQEQRARAAANAQIEETRATLIRQRDLTTAGIAGSGRDRELAVAEAERLERQLRQLEERNERIRRGGGQVAVDDVEALRQRAQDARARAVLATVAQGEGRGRLDEIEQTLARLNVGETLSGLRAQVEERDAPATTRRGTAPARREASVSISQALAEITGRIDDFNEGLNLQAAGLSNATGALANYAREQDLLRQAVDAGIITEEAFGNAVAASSERLAVQLREIEQRNQRGGEAARQLGLTFSSAFEDAISKGKSFSDVLRGIEQDIARIIIRQGVTNPLTTALTNASGPITTAAGDFLSGLFRANGGPVTAGQPYIVGERGPEWFVPNNSGTVLPNGVSPGGGTTFAPTYNIDARGADPSMLPRIRAEMTAISQAAVAQFAESIQRGGNAARLVGRRA